MDSEDLHSQGSLTGRQIGHYRIQEVIGRGGMGEVYRAFDEKLQRTVAIKALPLDVALDPGARKRFLAETKNACKVLHPFVATVFDVVDHSPSPLLVMEFVPGRSLSEAMQEASSPAVQLQWLLEITEALAAIHAAGLVHRDLKPGNVMVTSSGHVKVMDFGVAQPSPPLEPSSDPTSPTVTGAVAEGFGAGTVAYMSPEQLRLQAVDARSDLFSLGILMFQMATGKHPFHQDVMLDTACAILHDPPKSGPDIAWAGPEGLSPIAHRLLDKDPSRRFQNAGEVLQALRALLPQLQVSAPPPPASWLRWQWAAAGLALLALGMSWWRIDALHPYLGLFPARPVVVVLPFDVSEAKGGSENQGAFLAERLAARLATSGVVRIIDEDRIEQALAALPPTADETTRSRQVGAAMRFDYLISGRLSPRGREWQAVVELRHGPALLPGGSFSVTAAAAEDLADRAAVLALQAIGAPASGLPPPPTGALSPQAEEARILHRRAQQLLHEYRLNEATGVLERACTTDPSFLEGKVFLARVVYQAGFERRARDEIRSAAMAARERGLSPTDPLMLKIEANEAEITGDADRRVVLRQSLASRTPDDPKVCYELASALNAATRGEEAQATLDHCLALDPLDPRIRLLRGETAIARGRWAQADLELREAEKLFRLLDLDRGLASVAEIRGDLELGREDFPAAVEQYREAEKRFTESGLAVSAARAALGVSDVLLKQGRLSEAQAARGQAEEVLRQAGAFRLLVSALNSRGGILYLHGRLPEAEQVLREALDEARKLDNPNLMLSPLSTLANLLLISGRVSEAMPLAEQALGLARNAGDAQAEFLARIVLAQGQVQQGQYREAAEAFANLAAEEKGAGGSRERRAYALNARAAVLHTAQRPAEAVKAVTESIALDRELDLEADLGYALVLRALILGTLGKMDEAAADLDAAETRAGKGSAELGGLTRWIALARTSLAVLKDDHQGARKAVPAPMAGDLESALLLAEIELLAHRPVESLIALEPWGGGDNLSPADKAPFLVLRAQALLDAGRTAEGMEAAREAVEMGNTYGLSFTAARSAALLYPHLLGAEQAEMKRRGCEWLAEYLGQSGSPGLPRLRRIRSVLGCN